MPDEGQGGFNTALIGVQNFVISLKDLGLPGASSFNVLNVCSKTNSRVKGSGKLMAALDEGESVLLKLTTA